MSTVRPVETDTDVDAWLHVRRVVLPTESAGTVEQFRERDKPDRLWVLAELDGVLAGSGVAGLADVRGRAFVAPRVLPAFRRRGVGVALLRVLGEHAAATGLDRVGAHADDAGSVVFGERFGFAEVDRQVEQVKVLGDEPEPPSLPDGVEAVTIAQRPELLEAAYPLASQGYEDMATDGPVLVPLEDWLREEATLPAGSFAALAGGEIVGYTGLIAHDHDGIVENGLTVVRRDWRRRGLATALKRRSLAWAAANGYREVVTWTQRGNDGMRAVNERLGFTYRDVSVTMIAPLPLDYGAR
jgi:GNAT superfamily N-acetyltransferase